MHRIGNGSLSFTLTCNVVTWVVAVPALVTMVVMLLGSICNVRKISTDNLASVVMNSSSCPVMNSTLPCSVLPYPGDSL